MIDPDRTMKSPLSHVSSIFFSIAGLTSGYFFNFVAATANISKLISTYHLIAYVFIMCLVLTWKHAPIFIATLVWMACLYLQGYGCTIIVLTSVNKS